MADDKLIWNIFNYYTSVVATANRRGRSLYHYWKGGSWL